MKKQAVSFLLALTLLAGVVSLPVQADGPSQSSFPRVTPEQATAFLDMIETYSNSAPCYTNLGDVETTVHALVFDTGNGIPALFLVKGYGTQDPPASAEPGKVVYRLGEANIFSFRDGALDPYAAPGPGSFTIYPGHIGWEIGTTDRTTYQEHRFSHLAPSGGIAETANATFIRRLDERTQTFVYTIDGFGADAQLYEETLNGWIETGAIASAVREGESRFVVTDVPRASYTINALEMAQAGQATVELSLGPSWWAVDEVSAAVDLGMVQDTMQNNWQAEITRGDFARLAISFLAVQYGYGDQPLDIFMEDYLSKAVDRQGIPFQKSDYLTEEHRSAWESGAFFSWPGILRDDMRVFSDVEPEQFKDQINLAYLLGIVQGVGGGRYAPEATITRQEAATLLARTYQVYGALEENQKNTPYTDREQIAPWALENVEALSGKGVFEGDETGTFRPQEKLTKEQAVATFYRLYQNMLVSRRHKNIPALFTPEEIAQQIRNGTHGHVIYEIETQFCTVIFMSYGGVMRPPTPSAYLVYPDSTYQRIEVPANAKDFQLAEGIGKLIFSTYEGDKYLLDLQGGGLSKIDPAYAQALLQGSAKGFYHRPFEALPQALRDSLTWDGQVETMEGYSFRLRTYTGPGITVVTTEAPEDALRAWVDGQLALPVEEREGKAFDAELEAEFEREKGREWLYSVTFTDDRYSTDLGLTVGDTVTEAERKGYPFDAEQLQAGGTTFGVPMEVYLEVAVENNVVTQLQLRFGIGRYVGKYWDI